MASTIAINPMVTTTASSAFLLQTDGFVQGTFWDDPAMRYQLEGGIVSSSQTTPIWGGLPLTLTLPALGPGGSSSGLGPTVVVAGSLAAINAWAVYNQASAGIITSSSNAPQYSSEMSVNFIRPGSLLRLALPVKTADVSTVIAGAPNQSIYWDPTNFYLTVTSTSNYGPLPVQIEFLNTNSKTVTYTSATGATTWTYQSACAIVRI